MLLYKYIHELNFYLKIITLSIILTFLIGITYRKEIFWLFLTPLNEVFITINIPDVFYGYFFLILFYTFNLNVPIIVYCVVINIITISTKTKTKFLLNVILNIIFSICISQIVNYNFIIPYTSQFFLQIETKNIITNLDFLLTSKTLIKLYLLFLNIIGFLLLFIMYFITLKKILLKSIKLHSFIILITTIIAPPLFIIQLIIIFFFVLIFEFISTILYKNIIEVKTFKTKSKFYQNAL